MDKSKQMVELVDQATGLPLTMADMDQYEWIETTNHSTSTTVRTYVRGKVKAPDPKTFVHPAETVLREQVQKILDDPTKELFEGGVELGVRETAPNGAYRNYERDGTIRVVLNFRKRDDR